jgi:hypothetical protein
LLLQGHRLRVGADAVAAAARKRAVAVPDFWSCA